MVCLGQGKQVVELLSNCLLETGRIFDRYRSTIEKEAYAIHFALQKLDHYLHNAEFVIRTDHNPLKYILDAPMQNKKIQLWALTIAGYNCKVEYMHRCI
jgi:hypothetical protein